MGHSNQGLQRLLDALREAGVQRLVDVRRYAQSRRNPQFNAGRLAASLAEEGIVYRHEPRLGGRREPSAASANAALHDAGIRGFADYMATAEFAAALHDLIDGAASGPTAIMCAEAMPLHCHRSLISDTLAARGVEVVHLLGPGREAHCLSPLARVEAGRVSYPALI